LVAGEPKCASRDFPRLHRGCKRCDSNEVRRSFSRLVQWRSYVHTAKFHRSQTNSNCETQFCASRVDGPAELKSRVALFALVTSGASGNAVHQHSCLQARHSKWSRQAAERVVRGQSACQRFSIARLSPAASPLISHRPEPEVFPSRGISQPRSQHAGHNGSLRFPITGLRGCISPHQRSIVPGYGSTGIGIATPDGCADASDVREWLIELATVRAFPPALPFHCPGFA